MPDHASEPWLRILPRMPGAYRRVRYRDVTAVQRVVLCFSNLEDGPTDGSPCRSGSIDRRQRRARNFDLGKGPVIVTLE